MIQMTLGEIQSAIGGAVHGDQATLVTGSVETDSRLVQTGSLFFAKPGEVTDGHNFLASAKSLGATAAVVERYADEVDLPQLVVANVVQALGLLAKFVLQKLRDQGDLKVIAVTGSNGKTTTKNMLRNILQQVGETVAPIESYNNEVGAPISILKITAQTKFLVVEMGAGGPGTIRYLTEIAQPDIAVVLKVGMAHAGEFGGIESTAAMKAELVEALGDGDLAILNSDDSMVSAMANVTKARTIWFGTSASAGYRADGQNVSIEGTTFNLHWPDATSSAVTLQILGEHHVMNALASATVADQLGVSRALIVSALEAMPLAERWRMQLTHRADGVAVINDAYNASPDSMKAALQTLAQLGKTGRRTIAVLGEMAELGEFSKFEHDHLGRLVVRMNIKLLLVVGAAAKLIHMGATQEGSYDGESKFFESIDEALAYLRGMLASGDIVLVKSSKSANRRHLGDDLVEAEA